MPSAIVAIVSVVASAIGGGGLALGGFVASFFTALATTAITNVIGSVFKKKAPKGASDVSGLSTMVRQPAMAARALYGKSRISGPIAFVHTTNNNAYLHLVVLLTAHEVSSIDTVYLDDVALTLNASGYATNDRFTVDGDYKVYVGKHLGSDSQTVDTSLKAYDSSKWTNNHRLRGNAYLYVRLVWAEGMFPNGIPNISAVVSGKLLYDPRTTLTAYSTNPALAVWDYLTNSVYGLNVPTTELDSASFQTAANVCEESVALAAGGSESRYTCNGVLDTAKTPKVILEELLSSMSGILAYQNGKWYIYAGEYRTPTVSLDESDLQSGITVKSRISRKDLFNTVRGVYVDPANDYMPSDFKEVTNATYVTEDNGDVLVSDHSYPYTQSSATAQRLAKIELEKVRQQITVEGIFKLTAFQVQVGDVIQFSNTRFGWTNKAFEVLEFQFSLTPDDNGTVVPGISLTLRETASSVYTWSAEETLIDASPDTDLPNPFSVTAPSNLTWESGNDNLFIKADGTIGGFATISWTQTTNQFVNNGGRVQLQANLTTLPTSLTTSSVPFNTWIDIASLEGSSTTFNYFGIQDTATYSVRARFVSTVGATSSWTTLTGQVASPKSTKPSDVEYLVVNQNGTFVTFSWKSIADVDLSGYDIRYGADKTTSWVHATPLVKAKKGSTETTSSVPPGDWTFFIKAVDTSGNYSNNATVASESVINPNNIIATLNDPYFLNGTATNLTVHYTGVLTAQDQKLASEYGWETFDLFIPTPVESGNYETEALDISFDDKVRVWGVIYSQLGYGVSSGIADPKFNLNYILDGQSEAVTPVFANTISAAGTLTNLVLDYRGNLTPKSQSLASALDFEVFDEFVPNPYQSCSYEAVEVDTSADRSMVVTLDITEDLGPGETTGAPQASTQIDYRKVAESYDGFESWTAGRIQARYIKFKVSVDTTKGVTVIRNFAYSLDGFQVWNIGEKTARYFKGRLDCDFTEGNFIITGLDFTCDKADDSQGATGLSIGASGTSVSFSRPYHSTPIIKLVPKGSSAVIATYNNLTTTGFDINLFNSSGTQIAGVADWQATGA